MNTEAIIAVVIAIIGLGGGFTIEHWRTSGEIATLEGKLATCRQSVATFEAAIEVQNQQIRLAVEEGKKAMKLASELMFKADQEAQKHNGEISALKAVKAKGGKDCTAAWIEIRKAK